MLSLEGLRLRAALFQSIRSFFRREGFLEVDTPIRQPVVIPEAAIVPIRAGSWYLQSSPEQCMKRLLARDCGNIFQICPCFRARERGRHHLEEFTMLEWYRPGSDYRDLMADCEQLLRHVCGELSGHHGVGKQVGRSCLGTMRLDESWERLPVSAAYELFSPIPLEKALLEDRFDEILVEHIEPHLGGRLPTFLYDYPAACASLACIKPGDERVAERFELYIDGLELANGFSELCDAEEQRRRFLKELQLLQAEHGQMLLPERFLQELGWIGKAAGIAFGLDRLVMLLLSEDSIDRAISFSPADW